MTTLARQRAYRYGLLAELLCVLSLTLRGYRLLARRYATPVGEIDLIAKRGRSLAFIEVKARETQEAALQSLGAKQRERIIRAAESYLQRHAQHAALAPRFDLMYVGYARWPKHIHDAFRH